MSRKRVLRPNLLNLREATRMARRRHVVWLSRPSQRRIAVMSEYIATVGLLSAFATGQIGRESAVRLLGLNNYWELRELMRRHGISVQLPPEELAKQKLELLDFLTMADLDPSR